MAATTDVDIAPLRPERFAEILASEAYARFDQVIAAAKTFFAGRTVWNVNSTARGGGVAEMLASLLSYAHGAGVDARWVVVNGNPPFFTITKRIHNRLHGAPGDGGPLGELERDTYAHTLQKVADELRQRVRPNDLVLLHDPQTAGLTAVLKDLGATVVWRCHVGLDSPNTLAREAWSFLRGFIERADAFVFSRPAFAWEGLPPDRIAVIPPSIDAFSPKNQTLSEMSVTSILATSALLDAPAPAAPGYIRADGTEALVQRKTDMFGAPAPPAGVSTIVQVSRWDRLKDPIGVLHGFVQHVAPRTDAHLVLAGPAVAAVSDDPEGLQVLEEVVAAWQTTPPAIRDRIHLACIPMDDAEENAAIVNALQRRADVIVQKSLAEGFGLTVAEGMWKSRPVVATRIGGIQDQIDHDVSGLLLDDPHDLAGFGAMLVELCEDRPRARQMGMMAKESVRNGFLGPRHLTQYFELFRRLAGA
jgi:trehalose synthase